MNKTVIVFCFLFLFSFARSFSGDYSVTGVITDSETSKPIPGASIQIQNTTKGTYSSSSGKFKLPFLSNETVLIIHSIGYESAKVNIKPGMKDTLRIKLKPSSVKLSGVEKTGDIEPDEIIRRAIARKNDNLSKLKTVKGMLYSKLVFELGGSAFQAASSDDRSLVVSATLGNNKVDKKYQAFILETFSTMMKDYEKNITRSYITQRRQTANLEPSNNMLAIGNFISFYDDDLQFLNADMITPLSKKALSYYDFKLLEKKVLDDRYVYVLQVIPKSDLYPLFEGTIKIVEGTYNLIELDLKPSKSTSIAFIKDVSLSQKFTEVKKDIWHPSYLEAKGKARVEVVKGLLDLDMDLTATSIFNDIVINEPLPDSIYKTESPKRTYVDSTADSAKPEFWDKNAMREITPKEKELYKTVDSLVVKSDSLKTKKGDWDFGVGADVDFNRVSSVTLGVVPYLSYKNYRIEATGSYSFGLRKPVGNIELSLPLFRKLSGYVSLYGKVFSEVETMSTDKSQSRLSNTISAALFKMDYYDFYRRDGWLANVSGGYGRISGSLSVSNSREFSLIKTTNRSIFSKTEWRENIKAEEGNFRTAGFTFHHGSLFPRNFKSMVTSNFDLSGIYGENLSLNTSFRLLEGKLNFEIPLISTGYLPVSLKLFAKGGIGSDNLPPQYQFKQTSNLLFNGDESNFYSAPFGLYGGTKYFSGHAVLELTDIWWRAIGLPLYEGRGINLNLTAASGKFFTKASNGYLPTGDYYSELGFGLGKIPTFISNVIFLSFDARWGIGPVAAGRFGWCVGLSLPF